MLTDIIIGMHFGACAILGVYGLHRVWLLSEFWRTRNHHRDLAEGGAAYRPHVTVQLPLFNERLVAERLIRAVCGFRYPRERLEIQVLDDSTDDTKTHVAALCAELRAEGIDIVHLWRAERSGYKAGALAAGTQVAKGELCAIFDADFVPPADYLERAVGPFVDASVGMVQTRWGHLNRDDNWLTNAQATFLDAHFSIDHRVRDARGRFFNFNGTAGIWRKSAIALAGGWDAASLTEDLDLSIRAHLAGVRFRYLDDVEVPAELPDDVNAFRGQQHRWAKGSMQTARRLVGAVLRADLPWTVKLDAALKLTQNIAFLPLLVVVMTMPVIALSRTLDGNTLTRALDLVTLAVATTPVAVHFYVAQRVRSRRFLSTLAGLPFALGLGAALAINNSRAVVQGLLGTGSNVFVRTAKRGDANADAAPTTAIPATYKSPLSAWAFLEAGLGVWHLSTAAYLWSHGVFWTTPFLVCFGIALLALSIRSIGQALIAPLRLARS